MNPSETIPEADFHQLRKVEADFHNEQAEIHLGNAALHAEVDLSEVFNKHEIELLEAVANGISARTEDRGRVHSIDAAYETAVRENEIFDAHTAALIENEIFDAHTAALEENKQREIATAEKREQQDADSRQEDAKDNISDAKTHTEDHTDATSYKQQAEKMLQDINQNEHIPVDSQVAKDFKTGNLIITSGDGHSIQIIESGFGASGKLTEYTFDKNRNTVTITSEGAHTMKLQIGEYMPVSDQYSPPPDLIELPLAVAKMVNAKTALPVK